MFIRKARRNDLPAIMSIYEKAREFMRQNGNPTQWGNGRPEKSQIEDDIFNECFYICENNGKITGVFALIIGEEPTYQEIQNGSWHSEDTYGTIHRLASDGTTKGIAKSCFDFCKAQCNYLRIDTHRDNLPMQSAIQKYGFVRCGLIHVDDGSERIAFDYHD